jgi:aspartate/methionine/tyrosine aminotransferase
VADRFSSFGQTIFTEISALAAQHKAVNLGQGFPDFDGADFVKDAAIQAIKDGKSQYALMTGVPDLAAVIAEVFEKDTGIRVDPKAEVTVTAGCTEAIASAFLGLCNPGDEVVVFEPACESAPGAG